MEEVCLLEKQSLDSWNSPVINDVLEVAWLESYPGLAVFELNTRSWLRKLGAEPSWHCFLSCELPKAPLALPENSGSPDEWGWRALLRAQKAPDMGPPEALVKESQERFFYLPLKCQISHTGEWLGLHYCVWWDKKKCMKQCAHVCACTCVLRVYACALSTHVLCVYVYTVCVYALHCMCVCLRVKPYREPGSIIIVFPQPWLTTAGRF